MVSVVALDDHGLPIRRLRQQAHSVPEIPAAGALAEVAADGSHVPDLRTGGIGDGFGKGRIVLPDVRSLDDAVQCDQGADARAAIAFAPYRLQAGNVFDIDDALGSENEILHEAEEIGPTSEDFGIAPVRGEQAKRLFHRART